MWISRKNYWEHTAPQGTKEWLNARIGRVNGSDTGSLAGESNFDTIQETGQYIAGIKQKQFSEKSQLAMNHGHKWEPVARDWYAKTFNVVVKEKGLCVSKKDPRIGASVDGNIVGTQGLIEIKCPQKMYGPIKKYQDMKAKGWQPPEDYVSHIWKTHYCQMQQAMWVLDKTYCDYIVYSVADKSVFTQRLKFNHTFWKQHHAKIIANYITYVEPYLQPGYPIVPQ